MDLKDKSSHTRITCTVVTSWICATVCMLTRESSNPVACDGCNYLHLYLESFLSETFVNRRQCWRCSWPFVNACQWWRSWRFLSAVWTLLVVASPMLYILLL